MRLPVEYIEARDIPDAWFQAVSRVHLYGYVEDSGETELSQAKGA